MHCANIEHFTRIQTTDHDPRLILVAPGKVARRELLLAAKKTKNDIKVLLHLSPQSRAHKSFVYYKATRNHLRIDDRGDLLIVYQPHNTYNNVKIDMTTSAQAVADKIDIFLGE